MLPFSEYTTNENTGKFRLNASSLFLTYARCNVDKNVLLDAMNTFFKKYNPIFCVVSHELHEDGGDHLHAVICLGKEMNITVASFLQGLLPGFHPNIQKCKSKRNCVLYVLKDGDYVYSGDFSPLDYDALVKGKKSTQSSLICELINKKNASLNDIIDEYPGFSLLHMGHIKTMIAYRETRKIHANLLPWKKLEVFNYHNDKDKLIIEWLNSSIKVDRPPRSKQLWIFGETALGKSSIYDNLLKHLHCIFPSNDPKYWDGMDNDADIIIFDEYHACKTIGLMNSLCEGRQMTMCMKNGSLIKTRNIPVLILSNYSPEEAYKNSLFEKNWLPFLQRFQVIDLAGKRIDPFGFYHSVVETVIEPLLDQIIITEELDGIDDMDMSAIDLMSDINLEDLWD